MFYCKVDLVTFMFDVKKMRFLLGKLNNYMHVARYHWSVRRRPYASDLSTRAVTLKTTPIPITPATTSTTTPGSHCLTCRKCLFLPYCQIIS